MRLQFGVDNLARKKGGETKKKTENHKSIEERGGKI